ncbi:MAG: hypothetical protein GY799_04670 [Desulfobulbaceae bacterium]|nr:hypothetical protein [Desulfobulbaceae bacterium]
MKTIRLFIIVLFTVTTMAHAADSQFLSSQNSENVQQMSKEISTLGVPEVKVQRMFTRMHQNHYQQQNIVRAKQVVMGAAQKGLPTEPIINKAMEGMVKLAKEQQVIKAMEAVRNRHEYAYKLAKSLSNNKNASHKMAGAIADSLTAGMNTQDMDRVASQLQTQTRQQTKNQAEDLSFQTMQTVRTMARLGTPASDVSDTICLALQHQYNAEQMAQLRHNFSRDTQQTSAKQLTRQYANSIDKGETPGNSSGDGNNSGESSKGADSGSGEGNGGSGGGGSGGGSGGDSK